MLRRGALARRSAAEWLTRALLAAVVASAGYAAVSGSLAFAMRGSDLERAHVIAPSDGRITALLSQQLSDFDATPEQRRRADRLARVALQQDTTAVAPVATLGVNAQVRGDTAAARYLFGYAETLSRRDLRTQLWAIEDAVGRGDIPGALRHYDVALRTGRNTYNLLFPVLSSAITDAPIRAALAHTLAQQPIWAPHFINYVAVDGPDPRATARLFGDLRRAGIAVPDATRASLIDRLIAGTFLDDAWLVYAAAYPGADRRTSRDPNFAHDSETASRLDWTLAEEPGISVGIQRDDRGGGVFTFAAPPSLGGRLLQQVQLLPPGSYQLAGRSAGIEQVQAALPYWTLACGDGRELGRVAVPNSAQANGIFAGRFSVPAGCPVQTLSLVTPSSDAIGGLSGEIRRAWLRPVR